MAKVKTIPQQTEETQEPATVEQVEEIEEPATVEQVEEIEEPATVEQVEEIKDISKDFENTLKNNAQKEKQAPLLKEGEQFETIIEDNEDDNNGGFNWIVFISGFFLLIVGAIAFLLFKDDNKSIVESETPTKGNQEFKDFL